MMRSLISGVSSLREGDTVPDSDTLRVSCWWGRPGEGPSPQCLRAPGLMGGTWPTLSGTWPLGPLGVFSLMKRTRLQHLKPPV